MDNKLIKMLIESLEKINERNINDDLAYISRRSGKFGRYSNKKAKKTTLFDVENIISNLIKSTELSDVASEKEFKILRDKFEAPRSYQSVDQIMSQLEKSFKVEDLGGTQCVDVGTVAAKYLVNTAIASVLSSFNASSAGFVSERLVAGLLGGVTIPATGAKTIADLQIGNCGISLKIKKSGIKGSGMDLIKTLGIKHVYTDGDGKETDNSQISPVHSDGLYYLIGAKAEKTIKFYCFKVDPIQIGNLLPAADENGIRNITSDDIKKLEKDSFLSIGDYITPKAKKVNLKATQTNGIADLKTADFLVQTAVDEVDKKREFLGSTLGNTLYGLNNYLSIIKDSILQYSIDPTEVNLKVLLDALQESTTFISAALKKC